MLKRIYTLLTVLALISALFAPVAPLSVNASSYYSEAEFDSISDFLSQLSITSGINKAPEDTITRDEFTAMTVRAMNMVFPYDATCGFGDIASNPFKAEISSAKRLGLTNGTTVNTFSPYEAVGAEVASKMTVTALGYQLKAEAMGGYPTGYMRLSSSLGIFKGVNTDGALTLYDAYLLIHNALYCDMALFSGVSSEGTEIQSQSGRNLLTENFKLSLAKGVVTTAGIYSAHPDSAQKGVIEVDGCTFKMPDVSRTLLGYDVDVWYSDKSDEVKAVYKNKTNSETVLFADKIVSVADNTVIYENENGKEIKYKLDTALSFILNGRIISHSNSSFIFPDGKITLIDNDGDGRYEYAIAEKTEYFVISAITANAIYDSKSAHKCIDFDANADCSYEIELNGKKANVSNLEIGMVCEVMMSDDNLVCLVKANAHSSVSGEITEIDTSKNSVVLNGSKYEYNSYFGNLGIDLKLGISYKFLLDSLGRITAVSGNIDDGSLYGYLLGFKESSGLGTMPMIKLLTAFNHITTLEIADKLKLDGISVRCDSPDLTLNLKRGDLPAYQLIKYKVSKGKITSIDLATSAPTHWQDADKNYADDDSLTQFVDCAEVRYRNDVKFGVPNVAFNQSIIFSVPKELATNPDKLYSDDMFSVISVASLTNNGRYKTDAFDYNENYLPAATVIYRSANAKTADVPSANATPFIVHDITDVITEDGVVTKLLKVYNGKKFYEYYVEEGGYETIKNDDESLNNWPNPGDVVRLALDDKGFVVGIARDIKYNKTSHTLSVAYGKNNIGGATSAVSQLFYFQGTALAQSEGYLTLKSSSLPSGAMVNGENVATLCVDSAARYVKYNASTNTVSPATQADVITAYAAGEQNASLVACYSSYYNVETIYIYTR